MDRLLSKARKSGVREIECLSGKDSWPPRHNHLSRTQKTEEEGTAGLVARGKI
jgi:hypothetical protein